MRTSISTKGRLVVPAQIRREDAIRAGEQFDFERVAPGEYRLLRVTPPPNEGLVAWLLVCPETGFFVPVESESTDAQ